MIQWQLGPDLPRGQQDGPLVLLGKTLAVAGGFTGSSDDTSVPQKATKYPAGFWADGFSLDLDGQGAWQKIPAWDQPARQGLGGVAVDGGFYVWGGFHYSTPPALNPITDVAEGARWEKGAPSWETLPPLPYPLAGLSLATIGKKIFLLGGAQDGIEEGATPAGPRTHSLVGGSTTPLGARLWVFDTEAPEQGWSELAPLPGTPRYVHAFSPAGGKLYVLGGATGVDHALHRTCNVIDNWEYNPALDAWKRVADLPVSSANFPGGASTFQDRYLVLVGGYPYGCIEAPGGVVEFKQVGEPYSVFPPFGIYSDVWLYDTQKDSFQRTTPLPLTNNLPSLVVEGNTLHMVGGETGGAGDLGRVFLGDRYFGHRPDLYLRGAIVPESEGESALFHAAFYRPLPDAQLTGPTNEVAGVCRASLGEVTVALGSETKQVPCASGHFITTITHSGAAGNVALGVRQAGGTGGFPYEHQINVLFLQLRRRLFFPLRWPPRPGALSPGASRPGTPPPDRERCAAGCPCRGHAPSRSGP